MNLRRLSSRATVAAASTALAAGSVLAVAPAHAAEASNTYTCALGPVNIDIPLTVTGSIPTPVWAGMKIPAKNPLLNGTAVAQIPELARGLLQAQSIDSAYSKDFSLALGSASVPLPADGTFSEDYSTWNGAAQNAAFTTPKPGTYTVSMPSAFTFTTVNDGQDSNTLNCTLAEGQEAATLGDVQVMKQTGVLTAPKTVTAKKGKVAKIKVSVVGDAGPASGKVTAAKGAKKFSATLKNGAAVIKLGKLPVGKHKFTVSFAGNANISGDSAKTLVKVTR